jgi:hypothetical protein
MSYILDSIGNIGTTVSGAVGSTVGVVGSTVGSVGNTLGITSSKSVEQPKQSLIAESIPEHIKTSEVKTVKPIQKPSILKKITQTIPNISMLNIESINWWFSDEKNEKITSNKQIIIEKDHAIKYIKKLIINKEPGFITRNIGNYVWFPTLDKLPIDEINSFSTNNLTLQINYSSEKKPVRLTMKLSDIKQNYNPSNINDYVTKENIFNTIAYIFINSPNPQEPVKKEVFKTLIKLNNDGKIIFEGYYTGGKRKTRRAKKSTNKRRKNKTKRTLKN